jgi:hypothetical protein
MFRICAVNANEIKESHSCIRGFNVPPVKSTFRDIRATNARMPELTNTEHEPKYFYARDNAFLLHPTEISRPAPVSFKSET